MTSFLKRPLWFAAKPSTAMIASLSLLFGLQSDVEALQFDVNAMSGELHWSIPTLPGRQAVYDPWGEQYLGVRFLEREWGEFGVSYDVELAAKPQGVNFSAWHPTASLELGLKGSRYEMVDIVPTGGEVTIFMNRRYEFLTENTDDDENRIWMIRRDRSTDWSLDWLRSIELFIGGDTPQFLELIDCQAAPGQGSEIYLLGRYRYGTNETPFLAELNANGTLSWARSLVGLSGHTVEDLLVTEDELLIAARTPTSIDADFEGVLLARYSLSGQSVTAKRFPSLLAPRDGRLRIVRRDNGGPWAHLIASNANADTVLLPVTVSSLNQTLAQVFDTGSEYGWNIQDALHSPAGTLVVAYGTANGFPFPLLSEVLVTNTGVINSAASSLTPRHLTANANDVLNLNEQPYLIASRKRMFCLLGSHTDVAGSADRLRMRQSDLSGLDLPCFEQQSSPSRSFVWVPSEPQVISSLPLLLVLNDHFGFTPTNHQWSDPSALCK